MKIYVASDFTNRKGVKKLAAILSAAGHTVVSSWHSLEPFGNDKGATGSDRQLWAFKDLADLDQADILVRLGGNETGRGGQFVELGYAIARCKPCFILNHDNVDNIFEFVYGVFICSSIADLLSRISVSGRMQYVLPYPEEMAKQKEQEVMKLEALCTRYSFFEDAKKIGFKNRETEEVVYTGDAGVPRDAQINAAYATLMGSEDPAEVLTAAGIEPPVVEEPTVDAASLVAPKQPEVISGGGTGVVAGNRFDKTADQTFDDSIVNDKE